MVRKEYKMKKLSVIIPVYNEKNNLKKIIKKVQKNPLNKEIILIDDASTDGSRELIKKEYEKVVDQVIYHKENKGKGASLKDGIKKCKGDVIIFQDADLEYDPKDYEKIVTPIYNNEAQVVYGSRFLKNNKNKGYLTNYLANRFLSFIASITMHQKLSDVETCYKAFDAKLLKSISLDEDRFGLEIEITSKISAKNIKIKEVPISYNPRTKEEGKKIGFRDGINALKCLYKYRVGKNGKERN